MIPSRRHALALAAACTLLLAGTAGAQTTAPGSLTGRSVLPGLAAEVARLAGQTPAAESASEPDPGRSDPLGLTIVLPETLHTLDTLIGRASTALLPALQQARTKVAAAERQLHDGSRGERLQFLAAVLRSMAGAQTALGDALTIASGTDSILIGLLVPAIQKARDAAARAANRMVDQARAAGVGESRLAPALEALHMADTLIAAGDWGGGAQQHALALELAADTLVFSMDRFESNLRSVFDAHTVGWSYALTKAGVLVKSGADGDARTSIDHPRTDQSSTKPMHVASVSKTLTAIVLLRRLQEMGLPVDSPIGPWLPAGWARGAGVNTISFGQLLRHRSGFGQNAPSGSSYAALQALVAQGVPFKGSFDYDNANYGLVRVLMAKLLGVDAAAWPPGTDAGALTAGAFITYAKARYAAAGVAYGCEPQVATPTLQYEFPDTGNPGYVEPPRGLSCGGFGAFASAQSLARTLVMLRYTSSLMSPKQFQQMKLGHLGFMNPADGYDFAEGSFGAYHVHGGDWDHTGSGGLDTCVMAFPIQVEAAVLINSSRKSLGIGYPHGGYQCKVLKWAFEHAWIAQ